jgi:hypothetical protein
MTTFSLYLLELSPKGLNKKIIKSKRIKLNEKMPKLKKGNVTLFIYE